MAQEPGPTKLSRNAGMNCTLNDFLLKKFSLLLISIENCVLFLHTKTLHSDKKKEVLRWIMDDSFNLNLSLLFSLLTSNKNL